LICSSHCSINKHAIATLTNNINLGYNILHQWQTRLMKNKALFCDSICPSSINTPKIQLLLLLIITFVTQFLLWIFLFLTYCNIPFVCKWQTILRLMLLQVFWYFSSLYYKQFTSFIIFKNLLEANLEFGSWVVINMEPFLCSSSM